MNKVVVSLYGNKVLGVLNSQKYGNHCIFRADIQNLWTRQHFFYNNLPQCREKQPGTSKIHPVQDVYVQSDHLFKGIKFYQDQLDRFKNYNVKIPHRPPALNLIPPVPGSIYQIQYQNQGFDQ